MQRERTQHVDAGPAADHGEADLGDERLVDVGRALAASLLGDIDLTVTRRADGPGRREALVVDRADDDPPPRGDEADGRAPDPPRVIVVERRDAELDRDRDDAPSVLRSLAEWGVVIAVAVAAAMVIQTFALRIYEIPSESMSPALEIGDRVLVNKLSYTFGGDVGRGDVVVFDNPEREAGDPDTVPEKLVKRVIGLPGDVVTERGGRVHIDDEELDEPYLAAGTVTDDIAEPIVVGEGEVLVLGDDRSRSHDGRFFGPIEQDRIVGRAATIVWPPGRFGRL